MADDNNRTSTEGNGEPTDEQKGNEMAHAAPSPKKPTGATRQAQVYYGIVSEGLTQVERTVPDGEPPALPENAKLKVIGKPVKRQDALAKVTGKARYTYDVQLPGQLWGRMVCSPVAHAKVKSIDTSEAEKYPGVRAVHVLTQLFQTAQLRNQEQEPKYPTIRYAGQPVAAVAAQTQRAADAAARLVKIEYEAMPHVTEIGPAMEDDAPLVFPGPVEQPGTAGGGGAPKGLPQKGNMRGPNTGGLGGGPKGNIDTGFAEADHVIEMDFTTQVQTHVPMETHGIVADWKPEGLTIYASTQGVNTPRDEAAEAFNLPKNKIRSLSDYTGGGFGAKYGINNFGLLAIHLSKKSGLPVRMMLDRREEHQMAGNRPNSIQKIKVGVKNDGALAAMKTVAYGSGGVAGGAGIGFCYDALYACPNIYNEQWDVFTNAGPCAAFRAPGQVQGIFSLEQMMDAAAEKIGMDPLDFRDKIDTKDLDDARARKVERREGAKAIGWADRKAPAADAGPIKRGLGMAQSQWIYLVHTATHVDVRISDDGSIDCFCATQDIGTGTKTVMAQTVAEEFGLTAEDIGVYIGDSNYPVGAPSGGSRVTSSVTPAARNAAHKAKGKLSEQLAKTWKVEPDQLVYEDGRVMLKGQPDTSTPLKEAVKKAKINQIIANAKREDDYEGWMIDHADIQISKHGIGGVQFADVSVDTETGVVKVNRIVAAHDCGRPINPKLTESQINGGVIQGISYALYEHRILDPHTGFQLNANIDQYKMVGSKETPQIDVILLEQLGGQSSTDARGVAEPANVATAAAIANAFYNATGKRITKLPMNPANVLEALAADDADLATVNAKEDA